MPPEVITFYSFKGGVGRTQALANIAVGMANRGHDVIAVDLDLESPGLHTFFCATGTSATPLSDIDLGVRDGLLEHLERCRELPAEAPAIEPLLVEVTHPTRRAGAGWIRLLPAGRLVEDYPERVARFSWEKFYEEHHGSQYMELLRDQLLRTGADYVLLDSRTGMTDIASICTFQLPDVVVILFALHQQGIDGACRVAQAIDRTRREEGDAGRPRRMLLVASRVDEQGELELRDEWLRRARVRMSGLGDLLVEHGQHIPYLPKVAYGEQIIVDPPEPNLLSEAYKYLLSRLIEPASAKPSPERRPFSELRNQANRLAERMRALASAMEACQPVSMTLTALHQWVQERLHDRDALLGDARTLTARIHALEAEIDPARVSPNLPIEASPDAATAWRLRAEALVSRSEATIAHWIQVKTQSVRARLLEAAEGDDLLLAPYLEQLKTLLSEGLEEEIAAQLPSIEQEIARSGLEGLLRQNQLDLARLSRSRPDPGEQGRWIEDKLHQLLSEGAFEAERQLMLWNLLRLRAELGATPADVDWTAYDALCSLSSERKDATLFAEIGAPLWRSHWRQVFDVVALAQPLESPAATFAAAQLERVLRDAHPAARELVEQIAHGLLENHRQQRMEMLAGLLERRRDDAAPRAALSVLARRDDVPARTRIELFSLWLLQRNDLGRDEPVVEGYLIALLEEGLDAEAFYALHVLRQSGALQGSAGPPEIYVGFLLHALETARAPIVDALLADSDFLSTVVTLRSGAALLLCIALRRARSRQDPTFRHTVLRLVRAHRSTLGGSAGTSPAAPPNPRSDQPPPRLLDLLEHPSDIDGATAIQARTIVAAIEAEKRPSFYRSWQPSTWFEQHFEQWVSDELRELKESPQSRAERHEIYFHRWDDTWIERAYHVLKARGAKVSIPGGKARDHIVAALQHMRQLFLDLNALRPPSGQPTLAKMLEFVEWTDDATADLRGWLEGEPGSSAVDRALSRRVERLIIEGVS